MEKKGSKLPKQLLQELPYNGINIVYAHGQFNNSLSLRIPSKRYLQLLNSILDIDIFNQNDDNSLVDPDLNRANSELSLTYFSKCAHWNTMS